MYFNRALLNQQVQFLYDLSGSIKFVVCYLGYILNPRDAYLFWVLIYFGLYDRVIYELISKRSHEGKLKAEGNGGTHKPCDRMNGHKANERITKAANERTDKITFERTNKPDNRTSEIPAKQTENDQRIEQTPAYPTPNNWLKYTSPFSKRGKSGASLVQDIEKHFRVGFKDVRAKNFYNTVFFHTLATVR